MTNPTTYKKYIRTRDNKIFYVSIHPTMGSCLCGKNKKPIKELSLVRGFNDRSKREE